MRFLIISVLSVFISAISSAEEPSPSISDDQRNLVFAINELAWESGQSAVYAKNCKSDALRSWYETTADKLRFVPRSDADVPVAIINCNRLPQFIEALNPFIDRYNEATLAIIVQTTSFADDEIYIEQLVRAIRVYGTCEHPNKSDLENAISASIQSRLPKDDDWTVPIIWENVVVGVTNDQMCDAESAAIMSTLQK